MYEQSQRDRFCGQEKTKIMTLRGLLACCACAKEFYLYNALMDLICEKLNNNNSMAGRIVQ